MGELEQRHRCRGYSPTLRVPGEGMGWEPRGAQSWRSSGARRGRGAKGLVDPTQKSSGFPSQKLRCALEVPGTSVPLLIWDPWMLQTVSNLPKQCWGLGPSTYVWRRPFDLPGSWPWGGPLTPCPAHPTSATALGATSGGLLVAGAMGSPAPHPAPAGLAGEGSPGKPQGWGTAGGCLAPATSLVEGLRAGNGSGSAPHLTLFWLLGD